MKPSKKRTTKHWPIDLEVVPVTEGFALVLNDQPLDTDTGDRYTTTEPPRMWFRTILVLTPN